MNILKKLLTISLFKSVPLFLFSVTSSATNIPTLNQDGSVPLTFEDSNTLGGGSIDSLQDIFGWLISLFQWLGWVGVVIGVSVALFALIYKLIGTPSEEAQAAVQGAITKSVFIVLAGILLLSIGFIISQIGNLFGLQLDPNDVL